MCLASLLLCNVPTFGSGQQIKCACERFLQDRSRLRSDEQCLFIVTQYLQHATAGLFCRYRSLWRRQESGVVMNYYKSLLPSEGNVLDFYTRCYQGIQLANSVIFMATSLRSHRLEAVMWMSTFYQGILLLPAGTAVWSHSSQHRDVYQCGDEL